MNSVSTYACWNHSRTSFVVNSEPLSSICLFSPGGCGPPAGLGAPTTCDPGSSRWPCPRPSRSSRVHPQQICRVRAWSRSARRRGTVESGGWAGRCGSTVLPRRSRALRRTGRDRMEMAATRIHADEVGKRDTVCARVEEYAYWLQTARRRGWRPLAPGRNHLHSQHVPWRLRAESNCRHLDLQGRRRRSVGNCP
jgi:hypothetical protein